jgi:hypothetical protein
MSPATPDRELSNQGVTGDPTRVPEEGTARVESRITGGGGSTGGSFEEEGGTADSMRRRARAQAEHAYERAEDLYEEVREQADDFGDRAAEMASRARRQAGRALDEAEVRLEDTGLLALAREYPLLVAGLAFGAGFLLAGTPMHRRGGVLGSATGQLRSALLAGLGTALSQELRDMVDEHGGVGNLLSSITGRGDANA